MSLKPTTFHFSGKNALHLDQAVAKSKENANLRDYKKLLEEKVFDLLKNGVVKCATDKK